MIVCTLESKHGAQATQTCGIKKCVRFSGGFWGTWSGTCCSTSPQDTVPWMILNRKRTSALIRLEVKHSSIGREDDPELKLWLPKRWLKIDINFFWTLSISIQFDLHVPFHTTEAYSSCGRQIVVYSLRREPGSVNSIGDIRRQGIGGHAEWSPGRAGRSSTYCRI